MYFLRTKKGFTLIELLVVIAIIGILAGIVLGSLGNARASARDAKRKIELAQVKGALELYFAKCGSYRVRQTCDSGAYYSTNGQGWFNHPPATSVAQGLVDHGIMSGIVVDPSGVLSNNGVDQSGYLIAISDSPPHYTVWADLERPSAADIATQDTCSLSDYDNYYSAVPAAARSNYCVSD